MIDLEKHYRTEAGYEVKLSFIDDGIVYGHYKNKWGSWCDSEWSEYDGKHLAVINHGYDLVEIKPRIKQTLWLNIHSGGVLVHETKEDADATRHNSCIACIKVELDYEEGEGL